MGKGQKALYLMAGENGGERRSTWNVVCGARAFCSGCSTPSILWLRAREAVTERLQVYHLGEIGSHAHGDLCVSGHFPLALFPGCVLLYKQDFTKKLGLCCITCTYCSQTCQRGVTEQLDGSTWDFCSEDCKSKYLLWYCKVRGRHVREEGRVSGSMGCQALISREGAPAGPTSKGSSMAYPRAKGPAHSREAGLTILSTPSGCPVPCL